jgi:hypothetical protein
MGRFPAPLVERCYEWWMNAFIAVLLMNAIPGWRELSRRSWCTKQRSRLRSPDRKIVWVHDGEKMPWALWGVDHGFFELEWAGRLAYLRAVAAAVEAPLATS